MQQQDESTFIEANIFKHKRDKTNGRPLLCERQHLSLTKMVDDVSVG